MNDWAAFFASSPQLLASYVSGVVSILCAVFSGLLVHRAHRQRLQQELRIEKMREVRRHMEKADDLLQRVNVSFRRLATMAPRLDEDGMLAETTNTLDVYAEYTRHVASPNAKSYPEDVQSALTRVRRETSRLFLDLRRGADARAREEFAALMSEDAMRLHEAVSAASDKIGALVRVRVE